MFLILPVSCSEFQSQNTYEKRKEYKIDRTDPWLSPSLKWSLSNPKLGTSLAGGLLAQRCKSRYDELPLRVVVSEDSATQTVKSESISCILKLACVCVFLHFSLKYCFDLGKDVRWCAGPHNNSIPSSAAAPQLLRGIPEGLGMLGCLNACIMTGKKKKIGDSVPHPPRIPLRCPSELDASLFFFGETQFCFFLKPFYFPFYSRLRATRAFR